MKTLYHYAQGMTNCNFGPFNYGPKRNQEVYGSPVSPEYNLKNVRVKTYAYHAPYDNVFPPADVAKTFARLNEGVLVQNVQVNSTFFNHADFVLAKDARDLVYVKVLAIMDSILPAKR